MELYEQLTKLVSDLNEDVTKFYDKKNRRSRKHRIAIYKII